MTLPDHPSPEYELLIQQSQRGLRHYIFSIFPNHSASDDILQETNRILWEKHDQFEMGTNFLAWARTIARFQTLRYLKDSKRKSWLSFDSELVVSLASVSEARDEAKIARTEALKSCVEKLSDNDKELVSLRYTSKLSLKDIGNSVSRSEGALKQAFLKVRTQLKECIERAVLRNSNRENQSVSDLPTTNEGENLS